MREAVMRAGSACPTELAMEVVGGKWKLVILEHLTTGVRRFSELQRAVPTVTARMLTRQLRELEADKLVRRTVYPEVPPRVEYSLTTAGRSLEPLVDALRAWGAEYRDQHIPRRENPKRAQDHYSNCSAPAGVPIGPAPGHGSLRFEGNGGSACGTT